MTQVEQPPVGANVVVSEGFSIVLASDEPRVVDVDLASKLEFERPRKIRELIKRMIDEGEISDVRWRPTVGRQSTGNGGEREYTVTEYLLTEEQALLVAIRSDAPKAREVRRLLVRVFIAVRRGELRPAAATPLVERVRPLLAGREGVTTPELLAAMGEPNTRSNQMAVTAALRALGWNHHQRRRVSGSRLVHVWSPTAHPKLGEGVSKPCAEGASKPYDDRVAGRLVVLSTMLHDAMHDMRSSSRDHADRALAAVRYCAADMWVMSNELRGARTV